jgi:hypothetical protein
MDETSKDQTRTKMPAVVPHQRVVSNGTHAKVRIPAGGVSDEPRIELIREGDLIRAIDVTCSCGKRIRLVCEYA